MPTVEANGIEIYYERHGQGDPLTLVMGLACSCRQWKWMAEVFSQKYEVIVFDNRGVGRSGKPMDEYSSETMADDVAGLLEAISIDRTHLFGASFGGMIAQQFALRHPDRLLSLVLGCTMPSFGLLPPTDDDIGRMASASDPELPIEDGVNDMLDLFLTPAFREGSDPRVAELRSTMVAEREEQGAMNFMMQFGAMAGHDLGESVGGIGARTLVLCGDEDPIAPVANSRFLAEHIPGATLKTYPGRRHAFWVEQAKEASDDILQFLAAC